MDCVGFMVDDLMVCRLIVASIQKICDTRGIVCGLMCYVVRVRIDFFGRFLIFHT